MSRHFDHLDEVDKSRGGSMLDGLTSEGEVELRPEWAAPGITKVLAAMIGLLYKTPCGALVRRVLAQRLGRAGYAKRGHRLVVTERRPAKPRSSRESKCVR